LRSSGDEILLMASTSMGYFFLSMSESANSANFVAVPMCTLPSASSLM